MKRIFSKTAFSLLELIIASVLVIIVIFGIFGINAVLNNNSQDYGQRYLVKSETQGTLNNILNNVSLAVGSGTNTNSTPSVLDQGVLLGGSTMGGDTNSFCIHQQNPGDTWLCYSFIPATNEIMYCNNTYNLSDGSGYRGAATCVGNAGAQYLGTAYSITSPSAPTFTNSGNQMLFSITITNCLDNSAATGTCQASGTSKDPANNPEVQLSGSALPLQAGMSQNYSS